jgi:hypothetical protein
MKVIHTGGQTPPTIWLSIATACVGISWILTTSACIAAEHLKGNITTTAPTEQHQVIQAATVRKASLESSPALQALPGTNDPISTVKPIYTDGSQRVWIVLDQFRPNGIPTNARPYDPQWNPAWQTAHSGRNYIGADVYNPQLVAAWREWYRNFMHELYHRLQRLPGGGQAQVWAIIHSDGSIKMWSKQEGDLEISRQPRTLLVPEVPAVVSMESAIKSLKGSPQLRFPPGSSIDQILLNSYAWVGPTPKEDLGGRWSW